MEILSTSMIHHTNLFGDAVCLTQFAATPRPEGDKLAEFAARVCYRSNGKFQTVPTFLNTIVREKHFDVLEHSTITLTAQSLDQFELDVLCRQKYLNCAYYGYGTFGVSGNLRAWYDFVTRLGDTNFMGIKELLSYATTIFGDFQGSVESDTVRDCVVATPQIQYVPKDLYSEATVRLIGSSNRIFRSTDVAKKLNHATFYIEKLSRVSTHQLVRHRRFSFSQASQRYIDTATRGEWGYTVPESIFDDDELCADFMDYVGEGLELYKKFRAKGIPKEDARYLLSHSVHSNIVVSGYFEDWLFFLEQRLAKGAQWEIKEVAQQVKDQLQLIAPEVFT